MNLRVRRVAVFSAMVADLQKTQGSGWCKRKDEEG